MRNFLKIHGKTVLFGIYAGMAIGVGGLLNILANTYLAETPFLARLIGSVLFPIGLTMVCVLELNLFTGKIGYVLDNDKKYLAFLGLVYLGNIIGSLIFGGWCLVVFKNSSFYSTALSISNSKLYEPSFLNIVKFFSGSVLCGALVYIAILCYKSFRKTWARLLGIFVSIGIFVFCKFDHCIANMFYFTFSWKWTNGLSYLNIGVVTLGNSLGAIALNEGYKALKKLRAKNEEKSI